ncbi:MAG: alanine-phosphoribitol ligase [Bacillales bacterium]|jgi:D-alanine--poly(phosphoribitol) ligase subunit 1|nr:alanine-phosphoribitol ligase [Bacillales bacterium]
MHLLKTIEDHVLTNPERMAFISHEDQISYRELWDKSNNIAALILQLSLKKDSPILVYGHMEPEMLVCFLAAVKSGHPYIPIDISIPRDRLSKIVENSEAELILNVSKLSINLNDNKIRVLEVSEKLYSYNNIPSDTWVKDDESFYIIYTSGSTGNPKGVQISANNLQSFVDWMLIDYPINDRLVFLNQAPFSFDLSVMDIYPALASGGTIFAITKDMIAKPKFLFQSLKISNAQVWTSTPSFIQMCLMDPSFTQELLPELRVFLFCGEILSPSICYQLRERFPSARIYNTYGPTEATVAVTGIEVTDELLKSYQSLPVGRPKNDTRIVILEGDRLVEDGEKGEIVIVGPSVSKGYLGQKEITEKAFFEYEGEPAYRTGDAGFIKNNILFYKGRMDYQIKLHGYRMEIEDIEHQILKTSFVKATVVIPITQNEKVEYLMAAVIPTDHPFEKEFQLSAAIKKELGETLPAYMMPRKFIYCDELPMTANGKVDRKLIKEKVLV